MAWRLPVHGFSNYSCLSSREHCQPQFQWSGEKTPHTLTFRLPLAWPRLWYTRWDLGRVVWGSSNNSEKSRHFSSKMSILNAVRTGGKNDWENWGICRVEVNFHTKTYNNRSFLFFFYHQCKTIVRLLDSWVLLRHMFMSVIVLYKLHSETTVVLSTGGFVLSQQLGGMIGIRLE